MRNLEIQPPEERFWKHVEKSDDCWNWTASLSNGYGQFSKGNKQITLSHRFSYEIHIGKIPDGMFICHKCDNPRCVRPDHLFLGTSSDNMKDMASKGRGVFQKHPEKLKRGSEQHLAKLTNFKVFKLRRLKLAGVSFRRISMWIDLDRSTITDAIKGRTWAHVPFPKSRSDTFSENSSGQSGCGVI